MDKKTTAYIGPSILLTDIFSWYDWRDRIQAKAFGGYEWVETQHEPREYPCLAIPLIHAPLNAPVEFEFLYKVDVEDLFIMPQDNIFFVKKDGTKDYKYNFYIEWVDRYGKFVGEQLIYLFNKVAMYKNEQGNEKFEYVDNYRVCQIGNSQEENDYTKRYERGCCGERDWEVEVLGVKYKLGFNYGH